MLQIPDIHTKRLLDLADFIEQLPEEKFSMKQWGQISEPRCICGWFLHTEGYDWKDDWQEAANRLGLDEPTATLLFSPVNDWNTISAARAIRQIALSR